MPCTDCFKIDMGCNCPPLPPDKPLPFLFPLYDDETVIYEGVFFTHSSNPGKVGLTNGLMLPSYTSFTRQWNFAHTLPITIDPPPGFPGPGLVQATATMTVDSIGNATITMTNTGAGYTTGVGFTGVNYTFGNYFNTINVKPGAGSNLGAPTGLLALPLPYRPALVLASAKIIPQLSGYITNNLSGGSPINVEGKWYKNGIQIGQTVQKRITVEGRHQIDHYCPATTFSSTDVISYQITCPDTELVNFAGDIVYYVQYI